jgi:hypothetical protein
MEILLWTKRVKKTWLLPNHKLYSFNCFVLNDSFSNIFVHQTKRQKKITTQYFFSLASQTKNNFYVFITTQPFFVTLYILFGYCSYNRIFCIDAKRKRRIEKSVFFQTGTIRSEVSSLLSVFSRLFYADAHVGGIRRKA